MVNGLSPEFLSQQKPSYYILVNVKNFGPGVQQDVMRVGMYYL